MLDELVHQSNHAEFYAVFKIQKIGGSFPVTVLALAEGSTLLEA